MPSPGEDIQSWSTVAANNGTADPLIDWHEGQARASVNNSSRSEMAAVAKWRNLLNGSIVTTGTKNAQQVLSGQTYTTIPTNLVVRLKVGAGLTNTTSATLNMDGLGDVLIKTSDGSNLLGGELVADGYVDLLYNGTNWIFLYSQRFIDNQLHGGGGIIIGKQVFATVGTFTYTPTGGMECCIIECIGAGGGGGGASGATLQNYQGGGGGSGGYSRTITTAAAIGASQPVTVGAAGTGGIGANNGTAGTATSVGSLCVANGGGGGTCSTPSIATMGGAGAAAGTGDITIAGTTGGLGFYNALNYIVWATPGNGAPGPFGGGTTTPIASAGVTATGAGSGGSGGSAHSNAAGVNGGNGAPGLVIITELAGRGAPGRDGNTGPAGPIGPAGPTGPGTGDVLRFGIPTTGQIAQWSDTSHIKGVDAAFVTNCGRLIYVSGNQIKFVPYNGDRIKIYTTIYPIPAAGISMSNTGGAIEGALPSLAANTTYLVGIYDTGGGVLASYFLSTLVHNASTLAGNVGVEIFNNIDTVSIVGMVRTNASGNFVDTPAQRFVRSWFNRRRVSLQGALFPPSGVVYNSTSWGSLGSTYQSEWLNWSDETVDILFNCVASVSAAGVVTGSIGIDGTTPASAESAVHNSGNYAGTIASRYSAMPAEGYHYALPLARSTAASTVGGGFSSAANTTGGLIGTLG